MFASTERRAPNECRVPLDDVPILLRSVDGHEQSLQAQGLNVCENGIALRTSELPQVGDSFLCEFITPKGDAIQAKARVAWTEKEGAFAGELGAEFLSVDSMSSIALQRMVHDWTERFAGTEGKEERKDARIDLNFATLEGPMEADLVEEDLDRMIVEQPLEFLSLGTAVEAEGREFRGVLESISLVVEGRLPKLRMSINTGNAETDTLVGDSLHGNSGVISRTQEDTVPGDIILPPHESESNQSTELQSDGDDYGSQNRSVENWNPGASTVLRRGVEHAKTRIAKLDWQGARGRIVAIAAIIAVAFRKTIKKGYVLLSRFVLRLRNFTLRLRAKNERNHRVKRQQKSVGRSKKVSSSTKESSQQVAMSKRTKRRIILGGFVIVAFLLGAIVYSSFLSKNDVPAEQPAGAEESVETESVAERPETDSSPVAESLIAFGDAELQGGDVLTLEMSREVKSVEGKRFADGFRVVFPGALSLTRAGTLAEQSELVEQSMVFNRGDHAELSIRFKPGTTPAYLVKADGTKVYVRIAE